MNKSKIGIFFGMIILGALANTTVFADPVTFSNVAVVQEDGSRLDLASNPGTTLLGTQFDFLVDIAGATPSAGIYHLLLTFSETGFAPVIQTLRVPLFDGLPPDYSQLFTFQAQSRSFSGTPVVLSVALLEDLSGAIVQRQVYNFNVAQPVPEPATLLLLGGGLVAFMARRRSGLTS